jgi:hypothetical protein
MLIFHNATRLTWPLPLSPNAGRHPSLICTIGEAASFVEEEIRLGLANEKVWRRSFESLATAHANSNKDPLVLEATRVTQEALYLNNLLAE